MIIFVIYNYASLLTIGLDDNARNGCPIQKTKIRLKSVYSISI